MKIAACSLALLALLPVAGQAQDKTGNAYDAQFKYQRALKRISGVKEVTVGGINGDLKLIIRVENDEAKKDVGLLIHGGKLDGHPVQIVLAGSTTTEPETKPSQTTSLPATGTCASCTCPCHSRKTGTTVAEPAKSKEKFDLSRIDDPDYAAEECDIMREVLGKKLREARNGIRCQQMVGWTNDPQKIAWVQKEKLPNWPSKEMPGLRGTDGGFICYTYIKHRQFCPLGMKQILADVKKLTPGK